MAIRPAKSPGQQRSEIPKEQWDMPVSFDAAGQTVSLRDLAEGGHESLAFSSLTDDQRAELAARRIEMQPGYEMGSIGAGIVSQKRAAEEVRARTRLGQRLAQIEARVILHLIDQVAGG